LSGIEVLVVGGYAANAVRAAKALVIDNIPEAEQIIATR